MTVLGVRGKRRGFPGSMQRVPNAGALLAALGVAFVAGCSDRPSEASASSGASVPERGARPSVEATRPPVAPPVSPALVAGHPEAAGIPASPANPALERENADLRARNEFLTNRNARLAADNEQLSRTVDVLGQQKFDLDRDETRLEVENRDQQRQLLAANHELNGVRPATIWGRPVTDNKVYILYSVIVALIVFPFCLAGAYFFFGTHRELLKTLSEQQDITQLTATSFATMIARSTANNNAIWSFLVGGVICTVVFGLVVYLFGG